MAEMVTAKLRIRDLQNRWGANEALRSALNISVKLGSQISLVSSQALAALRRHEESITRRKDELAEVDEKTGQRTISPANQEILRKEIAEALDEEVTITAPIVYFPANFELRLPEEAPRKDGEPSRPPRLGLVGVLDEWPEFFKVKE